MPLTPPVVSLYSIIAVITTYITACRQAVNNGCIVYGGGALKTIAIIPSTQCVTE